MLGAKGFKSRTILMSHVSVPPLEGCEKCSLGTQRRNNSDYDIHHKCGIKYNSEINKVRLPLSLKKTTFPIQLQPPMYSSMVTPKA